MNPLKKLLRRCLLTKDERTLLDAPRRTVLRAMMSEHEQAWLAALHAAKTTPIPVNFNAQERDGWEAALRSPTGLKIEQAMHAWLLQLQTQTISAPSAEIVERAKFAWGARAGFEMHKAITRLAAAPSSEPESTDATDVGSLDQHHP